MQILYTLESSNGGSGRSAQEIHESRTLCFHHPQTTVKFSWAGTTQVVIKTCRKLCPSIFVFFWGTGKGSVGKCFVCLFCKSTCSSSPGKLQNQRAGLAACMNTPCQGLGKITKRVTNKTAKYSHSTVQRKCATKCLFKYKLLKATSIWFQLINTRSICMDKAESTF